MSLERTMRLVADPEPNPSAMTDTDQRVLRIAIATSDLQRVDEHFGSASKMAMFEVSATSSRFTGVCEFSDVQRDGRENKLVDKLEQLRGQHAVLSTAIGASAVRQLMARDIQPIKLGEASPISEVLEYFQREIEVGTTPWVNKAVGPLSESLENRLQELLDSEWDE